MKEKFSKDYGFHILNLKPESTGLTVEIIICEKEAYDDKLGPRIRIRNTDSYKEDTIPVFFNSTSTKFSDIYKFIHANEKLLLNYWNFMDNVFKSNIDFDSDFLINNIKQL